MSFLVWQGRAVSFELGRVVPALHVRNQVPEVGSGKVPLKSGPGQTGEPGEDQF